MKAPGFSPRTAMAVASGCEGLCTRPLTRSRVTVSVSTGPSTGAVPAKVISDCLRALRAQIPDKTMKVVRSERGENSFIVDVQVELPEVRAVQVPRFTSEGTDGGCGITKENIEAGWAV